MLVLSGCLCCAGCLSPCSINPKNYPLLPDKHADPVAFARPDPLDGAWHSVRTTPNTNLTITVCDRLNPVWWFGNADEPVAPAWYRPDGHMRTLRWHIRNPIHNFSHYVIGIADKESVRSSCYPRSLSNPNGGWNFAVAKYKHVRLPFVDYKRGKFEFYFGWRVGGNFGMKFDLHSGAPPTPPAKEAQGADDFVCTYEERTAKTLHDRLHD
jgi:hypothetical protein